MEDASLHVLSGKAAGLSFRMTRQMASIRIGRDPANAVSLPDDTVADEHALLVRGGSTGFLLRTDRDDVFIDGDCVREAELATHALLDIGGVTIMFEINGGMYYPDSRYLKRGIGTLVIEPALVDRGELQHSRRHAGIAMLDADRVMIAGGEPPMRGEAFSHAEVYSLSKRKGQLVQLRNAHSAPVVARLPNGKLLVAGGGTTACTAIDPTTLETETLAPLGVQRTSAFGMALSDGRVVVFGGLWNEQTRLSGEVYDPTDNQWMPLPPGPKLAVVQGASLGDDRMLLVVSEPTIQKRPPPSYLIYDGREGRFEKLQAPAEPRLGCRLVTLSGGRLLMLGGMLDGKYLRSVDMFDSDTRTFTPIEPMRALRTEFNAVALPDDNVLVAGGGMLSMGLYSAERFDATTQSWSGLPAIREGCGEGGALANGDGAVVLSYQRVFNYRDTSNSRTD